MSHCQSLTLFQVRTLQLNCHLIVEYLLFQSSSRSNMHKSPISVMNRNTTVMADSKMRVQKHDKRGYKQELSGREVWSSGSVYLSRHVEIKVNSEPSMNAN